ncbi:TlpA family protein disulfide reductase [Marinifilum flexuosum]|uniref:TlpA family protein disulfide reductase n=1 Tax=Marinifilum flexuosum TaxID=1117708 RepID=UPI00249464DD|nr:redoxin domain-containing protein [Marinifilum flexuosum]
MRIRIVILIALFFLCNQSMSQTHTSHFSRKIELNQIYNKNTGKLISEKEILELQKTKKLHFEPVINKFGKIERYEIDPNQTCNYSRIDTSKRTKRGDLFPPFVMKSIKSKTLDSEKFKGKYILLQFQFTFKEPFFIEKAFNEFEEIISELNETKNVKGIFISKSSTEESIEKINDKPYSFSIIADGRNFLEKYTIINSPTFILIDKSGNLKSYYTLLEMDKLKTDLKKIIKTK